MVLLLVPLEQPKSFTTAVRDAAALLVTPPTLILMTTRAESLQEQLLEQLQLESQLINIANTVTADLFLDPLTLTTAHLIATPIITLGENLQELHWEQLLLV